MKVNKVPKKHHYVYRKYLAPWTDTKKSNGSIWAYSLCEGKVFHSSLIGVAQQRYFNEFQRLTELEKFVVYFIAKAVNDPYAKLNKPFMDSLNALRYFSILGTEGMSLDTESNNDIEIRNKNIRINLGEDSHGFYESKGLPYLLSLLEGDITIIEENSELFNFLFFLLIQYSRTKKSRDNFCREFCYTEEFLLKNINSHGDELEALEIQFNKDTAISELDDLKRNCDLEKIHQYVVDSLSFFTAHQLISKKRPKVHLINVQNGLELLTSDHPVISLGGLERAPAFYYPLSPTQALILSFDNRSETDSFNELDVLRYNKLVIENANQHIFSASKDLLEKMMMK